MYITNHHIELSNSSCKFFKIFSILSNMPAVYPQRQWYPIINNGVLVLVIPKKYKGKKKIRLLYHRKRNKYETDGATADDRSKMVLKIQSMELNHIGHLRKLWKEALLIQIDDAHLDQYLYPHLDHRTLYKETLVAFQAHAKIYILGHNGEESEEDIGDESNACAGDESKEDDEDDDIYPQSTAVQSTPSMHMLSTPAMKTR
eukprot:53782_1